MKIINTTKTSRPAENNSEAIGVAGVANQQTKNKILCSDVSGPVEI